MIAMFKFLYSYLHCLILVSSLQVGTDKKKLRERYVILCDSLLIVCSFVRIIRERWGNLWR